MKTDFHIAVCQVNEFCNLIMGEAYVGQYYCRHSACSYDVYAAIFGGSVNELDNSISHSSDVIGISMTVR